LDEIVQNCLKGISVGRDNLPLICSFALIASMNATDLPSFSQLLWTEDGIAQSARWRSESGTPPPKRVMVVDDTLNADTAYRLAAEGTALVWRGDFQNARQLLQALARRVDRKPTKVKARAKPAPVLSPRDAFNLHRQAQSQRARLLAMVVIPLAVDYSIPLRRAPDWREACVEAYGVVDVSASDTQGDAFVRVDAGDAGDAISTANAAAHTTTGSTDDSMVSLRELLGLVGAHEWRKKGVEISALGEVPDNRIHPHYGVFSPVRGEYLKLIAEATLPTTGRKAHRKPFDGLIFDIGTGTGVLAAVMARRMVSPNTGRIIATELDDRALVCARENLTRLGCNAQVELVQCDLFPSLATYGQAKLIICNPPWLPARPSTPIEHAIYDPDSRMLRGFLSGLAAHLTADGEGWLVLSDLAEHLGMRTRAELLEWITTAGLKVLGRTDVRPQHPKATDPSDPLFKARSAELTSLWRLSVA